MEGIRAFTSTEIEFHETLWFVYGWEDYEAENPDVTFMEYVNTDEYWEDYRAWLGEGWD